MGIWFYRVLRRLPRTPTRNWYFPTLLIALHIVCGYQALQLAQSATPLASAPQSPTTLALTGIAGIILTCLLTIPWSIIDARIQQEEKTRTSTTNANETTSSNLPLAQKQSWQRPALGATVAAVTLALTYAIIAPPTAPVISRIATEPGTPISNNAQSAQGPQSLKGVIAWSMTKPSSDNLSLHQGSAGPILINEGTQGYVQGISEKDGSPLWEWKLTTASDSFILGADSKTSPDGRYLALAVGHSHPNEDDILLYRVVIIDTTTGKELWNTIAEDLDSFSDTRLVVTNRVAAVNRHVFDLSTGKELWQLPENTLPAAGVHASNTLLITQGEYRTGIAGENNLKVPILARSCFKCAIDEFTPVDDQTGKPKGPPLTKILTDTVELEVVSSHGWILLHNEETKSNTLHNIDTGKDIPAPSGRLRPTRSWAYGFPHQGNLSFILIPPDTPQSEKHPKEDYYLFSHTFREPIPLPSPIEHGALIPQGNTALWATVFPEHPLPSVRITEATTNEPFLEFALPALRNRQWGSQHITYAPTREGILIHISASNRGNSGHPRPDQFIMIK
ncbi:MAG: hypothetical protein Q4C87_12280 [Actinomycetaceae bacterium]|nr:hypothetical protein [Actinomycetaceae bacterium]